MRVAVQIADERGRSLELAVKSNSALDSRTSGLASPSESRISRRSVAVRLAPLGVTLEDVLAAHDRIALTTSPDILQIIDSASEQVEQRAKTAAMESVKLRALFAELRSAPTILALQRHCALQKKTLQCSTVWSVEPWPRRLVSWFPQVDRVIVLTGRGFRVAEKMHWLTADYKVRKPPFNRLTAADCRRAFRAGTTAESVQKRLQDAIETIRRESQASSTSNQE